MSKFGYQYILDCVECDTSKISDLDNRNEFIKDLINEQGMAGKKAGKPGITGYSVVNLSWLLLLSFVFVMDLVHNILICFVVQHLIKVWSNYCCWNISMVELTMKAM